MGLPFEPKQNQWILPHPFIPCGDASENGRPLFQFFHTSSTVSDVSPVPATPDIPPAPMPLELLDIVDDVTHANKKSRVTKPVATDVALSPNELAEYFKQPATNGNQKL
jgi:hypothetical protein